MGPCADRSPETAPNCRSGKLSNSIWHVIGTGTIGTGMVLAFEQLIKLELLLLRLFVLGVSWGRP
jgi:hypothetical protein